MNRRRAQAFHSFFQNEASDESILGLCPNNKYVSNRAVGIQILFPVSRYPPSTFMARLAMLPGSDPWSGSVRPKQPISSPLAKRGRYLRFCSSVPNSKIGTITSEDCTLIIER